MSQFNKQSAESAQPADHELLMLPCDQRYRTSKYFLEDQLRCSEAASDFRSVRNLFSKTASFNPLETFRFQTQAVPIRIDQD
jgi:hypothetical protein